jgi:hypothetical protein
VARTHNVAFDQHIVTVEAVVLVLPFVALK